MRIDFLQGWAKEICTQPCQIGLDARLQGAGNASLLKLELLRIHLQSNFVVIAASRSSLAALQRSQPTSTNNHLSLRWQGGALAYLNQYAVPGFKSHPPLGRHYRRSVRHGSGNSKTTGLPRGFHLSCRHKRSRRRSSM